MHIEMRHDLCGLWKIFTKIDLNFLNTYMLGIMLNIIPFKLHNKPIS